MRRLCLTGACLGCVYRKGARLYSDVTWDTVGSAGSLKTRLIFQEGVPGVGAAPGRWAQGLMRVPLYRLLGLPGSTRTGAAVSR